MDRDTADTLASRWIEDWNSRDLDKILAHYASDATVHSPIAALILPDLVGPLRGVEQLRRYWGTGLPQAPDLHFTLQQVLLTTDGFTVLYTNHRGQLVAETMLFNDEGSIMTAIAAYS